MMLKSVVLGLAAMATASPILDVSKGIQMSRREPLDDKEEFCKGWDFRTPEGADEAWMATGAFATLDSFIYSVNWSSDRWLKELEHYIFDGLSGRTGADGCGVIGGSCSPGRSDWNCDKYFEESNNSSFTKNAYWIFKAAEGVHAKFTELSRQMTRDTLISGLEIDKMLDDFGGEQDTGEDLFKMLGIAAGMAGTVGGLGGGTFGLWTSTGASFLGNIFSQAAQEDDSNPEGDLKAKLADAFKRGSNALEDTLRVVMGGGREDEEYERLPAPKWDTLRTDIGKFFNGGWWLIENDEEIVRSAIGSMSANIQRKVANDVLETAGFRLIANKRTIDGEDECGGKKGRHWLKLTDDEHACFMLYKHSGGGVTEKWEEAEDDIYEKLEGYGLGELKPYYESIIDCAREGDGEVDDDHIDFDTISRCYFNLPAIVMEMGKGCPPNPRQSCDPFKFTDVKDW